MKIIFITSFNEILFEKYAKTFLETFSKFSSEECKLFVYFEGNVGCLPSEGYRNVEIFNLDSSDQKLFSRRFKRFLEANGKRVYSDNDNNLQIRYNYRFDAIRFSFKIFSLCQALGVVSDELFCWIDADVRVLRPFGYDAIKLMFPEPQQVASYLGRTNFPKPIAYSECGFLGFNGQNPKARSFLKHMLGVYMSGDVFTLPEWHDCMVFDAVRLAYLRKGDEFKNLSGKFEVEQHPFVLSPLGEFFDHLKGPERKEQGKSSENV
jgi:hypothetical protein